MKLIFTNLNLNYNFFYPFYENIFFYYLFYLYVFSHLARNKDCSCSQVITQTGAPDVTQNVEFNDICDEEFEEIEGTITYTQCRWFDSDC